MEQIPPESNRGPEQGPTEKPWEAKADNMNYGSSHIGVGVPWNSGTNTATTELGPRNTWEFPKLHGGVLFRGPYARIPLFWSVSGAPVFWNLSYTPIPRTPVYGPTKF